MFFEFGKHMVASRHVVKMRVVPANTGRLDGEPFQQTSHRRVELMLSGQNLLIYENQKAQKEAAERILEIAEFIGDFSN